jgi:spermidine synthase
LKTRTKLATTCAPDGSRLTLLQHGNDFIITVGNHDLMLSRAHDSELDLARLGCAHLAGHQAPTVLIGGLGMGYTLRQTLDMLAPRATVVVAELLPEIVRWNRDYLGELTNHPLNDPRLVLKIGNVADVIRQSPAAFDAILLDVDNGPEAITDAGNSDVYSAAGIQACVTALRPTGCLAVWSAFFDPPFERRLRQANLRVRSVQVPAYHGSSSYHCCIWLASRDRGTVASRHTTRRSSPPPSRP